jgi:predicted protein tyrosine phosphatase
VSSLPMASSIWTRIEAAEVAAWPGLEGMDLAKEVTCSTPMTWAEACVVMARQHRSPHRQAPQGCCGGLRGKTQHSALPCKCWL